MLPKLAIFPHQTFQAQEAVLHPPWPKANVESKSKAMGAVKAELPGWGLPCLVYEVCLMQPSIIYPPFLLGFQIFFLQTWRVQVSTSQFGSQHVIKVLLMGEIRLTTCDVRSHVDIGINYLSLNWWSPDFWTINRSFPKYPKIPMPSWLLRVFVVRSCRFRRASSCRSLSGIKARWVDVGNP